MKKPIVYVHSGTHNQFIEYQKQNPDQQCVRIIDHTTLRARTYGQVICIGTYYEKWDDQPIQESIQMFESRFQEQSEQQSPEQQEQYGIGE